MFYNFDELSNNWKIRQMVLISSTKSLLLLLPFLDEFHKRKLLSKKHILRLKIKENANSKSNPFRSLAFQVFPLKLCNFSTSFHERIIMELLWDSLLKANLRLTLSSNGIDHFLIIFFFEISHSRLGRRNCFSKKDCRRCDNTPIFY